MAIDPVEYDVSELRELAGTDGLERVLGDDGFVWHVNPHAPDEPSPEAARAWEEAVVGETDRPFLAALPESEESERVVFEWLDGLVECAGLAGCARALRYYRTLEWLTESVEADLLDHSLGVAPAPGDRVDDLDRTDHLRSLRYIAELGAMD